MAASIIAAYCSGEGLYEGIGSLFGLFAGGGATAAEKRETSVSKRSKLLHKPTYDPSRSFHRRAAFPKAVEGQR